MTAADLEFAFADGLLGRALRAGERTSVELTRVFIDRLGLPAVPMLTGFAAAGTPTGAQLTGRHDNDRVLCVIADALLARLGPPGRAWSPDRLAEHWPWTAPARRG